MRRLLAFILILMLPLQSVWSLAQAYWHLDDPSVTIGFHEHHEHGHGEHDAHDQGGDLPGSGAAVVDAQQAHNGEGHHEGHSHTVFNMLVTETSVPPAAAMRHVAPSRPPSSFTSHIPPLFDWPPAGV